MSDIEQYNKWRGNVLKVFPVCLPELSAESSEDEKQSALFVLEKAIYFVAISQCPYGCIYVDRYEEEPI